METEEKKVYTIEDIARELGGSKTTVSRAISGREESVRLPETEYRHL